MTGCMLLIAMMVGWEATIGKGEWWVGDELQKWWKKRTQQAITKIQLQWRFCNKLWTLVCWFVKIVSLGSKVIKLLVGFWLVLLGDICFVELRYSWCSAMYMIARNDECLQFFQFCSIFSLPLAYSIAYTIQVLFHDPQYGN